MDRTKSASLRILNELGDFAALLAAFLLGIVTRERIDLTGDPLFQRFSTSDFALLFAIFYAMNIVFLRLTGVYPVRSNRSLEEMASLYARNVCLSAAAVVLGNYFLFLLHIKTSRLLLLSTCFYATAFLILKESLLRSLAQRLLHSGWGLVRILTVGEPPEEILHGEGAGRFRLVGWLSQQESGRAGRLGSISEIGRVLEDHDVDCVWFVEYADQVPGIESALWECEERGIEAWVRMSVLHRRIGRAYIEQVADSAFLSLRSGPQAELALVTKEVIDRVGGTVLFLLFLPVMAVVAAAIRLDSPGPALLVQTRVGRNGRKFRFYKFRSMVANAEELKESLRGLNQMKGAAFKIDNDPRITRLGRWLRRSSLDELPQLWNVVRGDMSLVGPRPMILDDVSRYEPWQRRRFSMKPGITCIWQVSGRSEINDMAQWARLDLEYIDNWTLWLDISLLLRTIPAVLTGRGAR